MKALNFKIPKRGLLGLVLTALIGGPVTGYITAALSPVLRQFLPFLFPSSPRHPVSSVPFMTYLLAISALMMISFIVFVEGARLSRVQNSLLVGICGAVFGGSAYAAFLIFGSSSLCFESGCWTAYPWWDHLYILGILIAFLLITSTRQAQEPICENCRRWYGSLQYVGNVPLDRRTEFIQLLDGGRIYEAGDLVVGEDEASPPNLEIYSQNCSVCQNGDRVITVKETLLDAKGMVKRKVLQKGVISFSQFEDLGRRVTGAKKD